MFGFQRTADLIWSAADQRCRGFLIGATAGGTTLNGEGLQHQDRASLLMALANPAVEAYDPSFAYEISVIVEDGLRRMFTDDVREGGEDVMYYLTVYNEPRSQPAMPDGLDPAEVIRGIYRYKTGESGDHEAHILSSGTIIYEALRAQELLADDWNVRADVWSTPGWNRLQRDAAQAESFNRTHPEQEPRVPMVTQALEGTSGVYVAVSDWMRATPFELADWIPGPYAVLGTDGFGRSDTREMLRRFHRIDAESVTYCVLAELVKLGTLDASVLTKAIERYDLDWNIWPYTGADGSGDVTE
jgi:pyruvate dehydrogenase E1 component